MAEPPKILQVTYGAFSCTLEGFEEPVEALIAVADYIRGLGAEDPLWAGGLRLPSAEELARLIADAQAGGGDEVRIDLGAPPPDGAEVGMAAEDGAAPEGGEEIGDRAAPPEDAAPPDIGAPRIGGEPNDAATAAADSSEDTDVQPGIGMRMDGSFDAGAPQATPGPEQHAETQAVAAPEPDGEPEAPPMDERGDSGATLGPEAGAKVPLGWFGDEEDEEPDPPSRFRDADEARVGVDLDQLALALAVRRSPAAPVETMPAAEAPPAEDAAPALSLGEDAAPDLPAPLPPPTDAAPEPVYDWGLGEEDDWFVSGAAIEPGPITMAPDPSSPGRRWLLGQSPDQDETVLLRILSRAESKLADPEAMRRRETIAHLKAAVAATEAERAGGDPPIPEPAAEDASQEGAPGEPGERPGSPPLRLVASQRVDLPRMRAALRGARMRPLARPAEDEMEPDWVQPRVPEPQAPATTLVAEASSETAPALAAAPLAPIGSLDLPPAEPSQPLAEVTVVAPETFAGPTPAAPGTLGEASTPRPELTDEALPPRPGPREEPAPLPPEPVVAPVEANAPEAAEAEPQARLAEAPVPSLHDGESFASFAASRGAAALPDLLEAATAWASQRSGLGEASRAEVAALAAEALPSEPAREEVLRVLGILLREGRLLKVGGGRLRAAPGSRFETGADGA